MFEEQDRPIAENGLCTNCGSSDMTLAEDKTDYSPCEWKDGEWVRSYTHEQYDNSVTAVRFFCASCGTPHTVPEKFVCT